eukprot:scaffold125466_cov35-Tisochrysis_lutea.AAC.2
MLVITRASEPSEHLTRACRTVGNCDSRLSHVGATLLECMEGSGAAALLAKLPKDVHEGQSANKEGSCAAMRRWYSVADTRPSSNICSSDCVWAELSRQLSRRSVTPPAASGISRRPPPLHAPRVACCSSTEQPARGANARPTGLPFASRSTASSKQVSCCSCGPSQPRHA